MKKTWLAALTGFGLASGCAARGPMVVSIGGTGTTAATCIVEVEGERMSLEAFAASSRRWRGREVHLRGDGHTPYRCIGSVIYTLQRAHARRIGFLSAPALESAPAR